MVEKYQAGIKFGDGMDALYCGEENPKKDRNGNLLIPILVAPSEELKNVYKLTDADLPIEVETRYGTLRARMMEYPKKQVFWLRQSTLGASVLIFCAFNGAKTELMKYYDYLFEMDEINERTISRQESIISDLLNQLGASPLEIARQQKEQRDLEQQEDNTEQGGQNS